MSDVLILIQIVVSVVAVGLLALFGWLADRLLCPPIPPPLSR